jgi:hypothetical protein
MSMELASRVIERDGKRLGGHAQCVSIDAEPDQYLCAAVLHPTDEDLSVGTPVLHPTDEDLSVGTPVLRPGNVTATAGAVGVLRRLIRMVPQGAYPRASRWWLQSGISGQKYGFQRESLGIDVLVWVVSRSLADYGYIFSDRARRGKLIATLDIFIEAGWPEALRLLYRLSDSLR